MTGLSPARQACFPVRPATQRRASGRTVAAYRDTFRLLVSFVSDRAGTPPSKLDLADLDAPAIGAFLLHVEQQRHNSVRTRNARLAAIHSFFGYAALRHPEHAGSISRVLSIPHKRYTRALVSFLTPAEAQALLDAPDRLTWIGRRDHTMLLVAVQTGLRVAELTGLTCRDAVLTAGPHVRCVGKGRNERCTPLTAPAVATLRSWLAERGGNPGDPLFPSRPGTTLSTDAGESLVTKYAQTAASTCPSLTANKVTPHLLTHTCGMARREPAID